MRRSRSPKIRSDGGYVLLEVLISILLFSLGVLGLITIQANAVQAAGEANMRAEAVFAANEITGRMWVDRSNLASYAGTTSVAALPNGQAAVTVNGAAVSVTVTWRPPGATANRQYTTVDTLMGN
ncbi:MAG: hypothetical protein WCB48_03290 [Casimicrobiaceae bacterium]